MSTRQERGSVAQLLAATAVIAACASWPSAQSLGELARQEEARRKAVKSSGKVYTNDALRSGPRPALPPAPSATTAAPSGSGAKPAEAPEEKAKAPASDPKKEEAAWRQRMQSARDSLQRAQMFAEALQSRINALTTDFTNRDDPAQRAVIATDRQKALAELDRVKKEIVDTNKSITAIQEEARRAGVPPGWLR